MKKSQQPNKIFRKAQYTAGDIAILFGVSHRTACAMIDKGTIKGFRMAGGEQRRVLHDDVLAYVKANPSYEFALNKIEGLKK